MDGKELPLSCAPVTLNPIIPREGERISISGYPYPNKPVLVTNSGTIASVQLLKLKEIPIPGHPIQKRPQAYEVHLGDVEINPGNSGGPVYLESDASVIGVCVSSVRSPAWFGDGTFASIQGRNIFYSSGLTTIIPTTYVIELLTSSRVMF